MLRMTILLSWLFASPVFAVETIEAIGAETQSNSSPQKTLKSKLTVRR